MYKLKIMFIPLAHTTSTMSTPSSPTPPPLTLPLDDGITTVKHYIYVHTQKPKTNATTKKYYFNWQENIKCNSHCIYASTCPYRWCPEVCGYCSRSNSYTQGSKIGIYARTSEEDFEGSIQRTYKSPFSWTPLAQSVFAGIPSPSRGPPPYFVTHPNYYNRQFHHYYPPDNPIPISQSPTTSAPTTSHSAGMNASQTSVTSTTFSTSTTPSTTVHCNSNTVPTIAREAHRTHTVFAPITLVESLTKTNLLLVADMKSELQSIHNQLSTIPF